MPTELMCGICRKYYDSDKQVPVCPHEPIEKVERERKAKTEAHLPLNKKP